MEYIESEQAPKAIGAYSQATKVANTLYLSGQIPLKPDTMTLVEGSIETQVRQVFDNLQAVCQAADMSLTHIVKLTVYLTDLSNKDVVNQEILRLYPDKYPARVMFEVSALPMGASIEIDAIAIKE